jgi:aminocarboxymuconate-semialdehyde decarboxylase
VTFPQRCTNTLKKKPTEYLKQLYYSIQWSLTPEGLRHLIAEVGANQIVLGTEYPFPCTKTAVDHVLSAPELSDAERAELGLSGRPALRDCF